MLFIDRSGWLNVSYQAASKLEKIGEYLQRSRRIQPRTRDDLRYDIEYTARSALEMHETRSAKFKGVRWSTLPSNCVTMNGYGKGRTDPRPNRSSVDTSGLESVMGDQHYLQQSCR